VLNTLLRLRRLDLVGWTQRPTSWFTRVGYEKGTDLHQAGYPNPWESWLRENICVGIPGYGLPGSSRLILHGSSARYVCLSLVHPDFLSHGSRPILSL
jgi:hypothetical protein